MLDGVAKWLTIGVRVDTSGVSSGMDRATNEVREGAREMTGSMVRAGAAMGAAFVGVTAAVDALARALAGAVASAKDYESGLNTIRAVTGANADEMARAESAIRAVNDEFHTGTRGAQEAATELLKAGVSIEELSQGALEAAVTMAKATGGTYADGATIAAKATQVFRIETRDMARVVQGASGVINSTTFELSDYTQALQQGGAAARSAGLEFDDFNALLALTATALGTTGSDTGTSARTFLSRLTPQSKEAADAMRALGLEFYDANGNFVGLAEAAQRLQRAMSGLSDQQKNLALTTIFGTDAQRQAIALYEAGAEGVEKYRKQVLESGNANEQAKIQTEGFAGATNNLAAAFDNVGAAISKSKIFELLTKLTNYAAGGVRNLGSTIETLNQNGLQGFGSGDPAVADLARRGRRISGNFTLSNVDAATLAAESMSAAEFRDFMAQPLDYPKGDLKNRNQTYLGAKLFAEAIKKAAEEASAALPTVNTNDLPLPGARRGGGGGLGDGELGDIVIKKISKELEASDAKVDIPSSFTNATDLLKANSEAFLQHALAMQAALQPIIDIVDDIKAELEYAIVRGDWSDVGRVFSDALRRVLYQSVMKDLVDSFGDMLEQVFATIFQRLSRSQSKGFDDFLGGVFDAVVGGVDTMINGPTAALAGAGSIGANAMHITVNAQDAVLTSAVKGWVAEGAVAAVNHSRGIVPADSVRKNMGRLS